jgi:hypothetical protein
MEAFHKGNTLMEGVGAEQAESLAKLFSSGYGLAAFFALVSIVLARFWMKEMRERVELSEKRASVIEQNNKLIGELSDAIKGLDESIKALILGQARRRGGS